VIVHSLPAYLHKSDGQPGYDPGTVWVQDAQLISVGASVEGDLPDWPCDVMDGALTIGGERHEIHIPVPLLPAAPAELCLSFDSVHTATVTARSVRLRLSGEPGYVEDFRR
jgi:hypothetical protein